ncbi:hypothetical protein [Bacillus sp. es.034]|uniref:hypothetical protein n=1 Tax=Bacillus sp. es.034 TaxID=1761763 RepID=UPI000BF9D89C|nr:hypothetical protein [Bacillus sp. es.034]PFG06631.1 hypothetical protein ATG71_3495 [Bacillus sp. es.034]
MNVNKRSVIIPSKRVRNDRSPMTVLSMLNPLKIITVDNCSTDKAKEVVKELVGRVILYMYLLGRNVPRAIEVYYEKGDILLVMNRGQVISTKKIRPFTLAVENGADTTLYDSSYLLKRGWMPHCTAVARKGWSLLLNKPENNINSFISIRHALDPKDLMNPSFTYVKAILSGCKVSAPRRIKNAETDVECKEVLLGDHMETIHVLLFVTVKQGGFLEGEKREANMDLNGKECDGDAGN